MICWLEGKGQPIEQCSFHLVTLFQEYALGVTVNCELIFWEVHGTLPILTVADLKIP
jgi:hypothetical protein